MAVGLGLSLSTLSTAAAAPVPAQLELPTPARADPAPLLAAVGAAPDRALVSRVPGPVTNEERVLVGISGSGAPVQVALEQRLRLSGVGDFVVRERGPARGVRPLGDPDAAPVTRLGTVLWQGFTPGDRELAAALALDPALEQPRLPVTVSVAFTPAAGGAARGLGAGGAVPGPGSVVVEVTGRTGQPARLPSAADAAAGPVAEALDAARTVALAAPGPRLPVAGGGLPTTVPVSGPATRDGTAAVPLRLTGRLTLRGAAGSVSGAGTTAVAGGAVVDGTLGGAPARFEVQAGGPGTLDLALTAVPALDPRLLVPPGGLPTWAAWAAGRPTPAARRAALDLLVDVAATGARAAAFSPYLGADLPGTGSTTFAVSFAPAPAPVARAVERAPRPYPIALAGLAAVLVLAGAAAVWRES